MNKYDAIAKLAEAGIRHEDGQSTKPVDDFIRRYVEGDEVKLEHALDLRRAYGGDGNVWPWVADIFFDVVDSAVPSEARTPAPLVETVPKRHKALVVLGGDDPEQCANEVAIASQSIITGFVWNRTKNGTEYWSRVRHALLDIAGVSDAKASELARVEGGETTNEERIKRARGTILTRVDWTKTEQGNDFWANAWSDLAGVLEEVEAAYRAEEAPKPATEPTKGVRSAQLLAWLADQLHDARVFPWDQQPEGVSYWDKVFDRVQHYAGSAEPHRPEHVETLAEALQEGLWWGETDEDFDHWRDVFDALERAGV
ncbi:MAG: hypothetical protein LC687_06240 [Actinobacteria bacterium]|nr:hypothetical protein [Actinomycetota bacterium]